MAPNQIEALRQAATALIGSAAAPTVLAALRLLLDDAEGAPKPEPAAAPPKSAPADSADTAGDLSGAADKSSAWLELRQRVRAARAERGLGNASWPSSSAWR